MFQTLFKSRFYSNSTSNSLFHKTLFLDSKATKNVVKGVFYVATGTIFYFYVKDSRAAIHKHMFMPLSHLLDPELSHSIAIQFARFGIAPKETLLKDDKLLAVDVWGKHVSNCIGLAAGFDKNAEAVDGIFDFGFGIVEIGSVTPQPQPGNIKPRMFRIPEAKAVINRYGFNSQGHHSVSLNLMDRCIHFIYKNNLRRFDDIPQSLPKSLRSGRLLGVNLGKNKTSDPDSNQDYMNGVKTLGKYGDYIVINVSSPNTPGLRGLQKREPIEKLLSQVKETRDEYCPHNPALLVKIAPDLTAEELQDIASVAMSVGIDGIIISNTTISRPAEIKDKAITQVGGLSGPPVKPLALKVVREFYKLTSGTIPIIGCGGISTAEDVLEFGKAGATFIQLYTALGYDGPGLIPEIKENLVSLLKAEGKTWEQIIGQAHEIPIKLNHSTL